MTTTAWISRHEPGSEEWQTMISGSCGWWTGYFSDEWTTVYHGPEQEDGIVQHCRTDRRGFDKFVADFIAGRNELEPGAERDDTDSGLGELLLAARHLPPADEDKGEYSYFWGS